MVQIRLDFLKKEQHFLFVRRTLLNFHDLEISILQNFSRASLYLQPLVSLLLPPHSRTEVSIP